MLSTRHTTLLCLVWPALDSQHSQILHVYAASLEHAQVLLRCGVQAGFRESGALNLTGSDGDQAIPLVAIRSAGLGLASLVGFEIGGKVYSCVSPEYLQTLVQVADERFAENGKRMQRFRMALRATSQGGSGGCKDGRVEWEDAATRRERKKAEGLKRSAELRGRKEETSPSEDGIPAIPLLMKQ